MEEQIWKGEMEIPNIIMLGPVRETVRAKRRKYAAPLTGDIIF